VGAWLMFSYFMKSQGLPTNTWFYSWTSLSYVEGDTIDPALSNGSTSLTSNDAFNIINRGNCVFYVMLITMQLGNLCTTRCRTRCILPMPKWLVEWGEKRQARLKEKCKPEPLDLWDDTTSSPVDVGQNAILLDERKLAVVVVDPQTKKAAGSSGVNPLEQNYMTIRFNSSDEENNSAMALGGSGGDREQEKQQTIVNETPTGLFYDGNGDLHQSVRIFIVALCSMLAGVFIVETSFIQSLFFTLPVNVEYWFIGLSFGVIIFFFGEMRKWLIRLFPGSVIDILNW